MKLKRCQQLEHFGCYYRFSPTGITIACHKIRGTEDKQKQQEFIAQKNNDSKSQSKLQEMWIRIWG